MTHDAWIIHYTPLLDSPITKRNLLYLPERSIVQKTLNTQGEYSEVVFITRQKTYQGWVRSVYLEDLFYEFPVEGVFSVPEQTDYPYDAAQYITAYGGVLYNLCGQGCVAWIYQRNIMEFLEEWQLSPNSYFPRIIHNGKSELTGVAELRNMVSTYSGTYSYLRDDLYDTVSKSVLLTPTRMKSLLGGGYPIVGVRISKMTGTLQIQGISHWIVVTDVMPDGIDTGQVIIYNPFHDRRERYSWKELRDAVGIPIGLVVHEKSRSGVL